MRAKFLKKILWPCVAICLCIGVYADGTISTMQTVRKGNNFSVVMYYRGNASCKAFSLAKPARIVVDCQDMQLPSKLSEANWRDTPILKFRSSESKSKSGLEV